MDWGAIRESKSIKKTRNSFRMSKVRTLDSEYILDTGKTASLPVFSWVRRTRSVLLSQKKKNWGFEGYLGLLLGVHFSVIGALGHVEAAFNPAFRIVEPG